MIRWEKKQQNSDRLGILHEIGGWDVWRTELLFFLPALRNVADLVVDGVIFVLSSFVLRLVHGVRLKHFQVSYLRSLSCNYFAPIDTDAV